MKFTMRVLEAGCFGGVIFTIVVLLGCDGSNLSKGINNDGCSASLTFQLDFASPPNKESKTQIARNINEPDICRDYHIDTVAVQVHRAQDDSEVASAQGDCTDHSLTVTNVPANENLIVVCKGFVGGKAAWQGQEDGIVAKAGQNTDIGAISMAYIGADTVAPMIISNFPTADGNDVDLNAWIVVKFNEHLSPGSIPDNAVTVLAGENQVAGWVTYNSATYSICFVPAAATGFDPQTTYTASMHAQGTGGMITDIAGHAVTDGVQWQFTTRGTIDTTAPQIIAVSPAEGDVEVALQSVIMAQFSEPMILESFTNNAVDLSSDQGTVRGQIRYDESSRTVTFTPESALTANTLYTAVVSAQILDTAQNSLPTPLTWQFKTTGPRFNLSLTNSGSGAGTVTSTLGGINCGSVCQAKIDLGAIVTIEANADESSTFTGWSGDVCDGSSDPCTFTMKADTAIAANFSLLAYTINVLVAPQDESGGTITPADTTVTHGEDVAFDINSNPYYHLSELLVDDNPVALADTYLFENVYENHSIGAVFDQNTAIRLSNESTPNTSVYHPQISANGHVVWNNSMGSDVNIYYWDGSFPTTLTNITHSSTAFNRNAKINIDNHIVWESGNGSGTDYEIYYWDGLFPPNPVNLSNNPDREDRNPQINAAGHVVWQSKNGSDNEIYYWNGSFPPKPINISNNSDSNDIYPQINADDYVVWRSDDEYTATIYHWDGTLPPVPVKISGNSAYNPQINAAGHVIWEQSLGAGSGFDIYYWDGSFSSVPVNISSHSGGDDRHPQLNAVGHVVWQSDNGSENEIYYWDGSFPPVPVNISNNSAGDDYHPQINAVSQVVWYGFDGSNFKIFFYDGSIMTKAIKISNNTAANAVVPQINETGHVIWIKNVETESKEIFLNCADQCTLHGERN